MFYKNPKRVLQFFAQVAGCTLPSDLDALHLSPVKWQLMRLGRISEPRTQLPIRWASQKLHTFREMSTPQPQRLKNCTQH